MRAVCLIFFVWLGMGVLQPVAAGMPLSQGLDFQQVLWAHDQARKIELIVDPEPKPTLDHVRTIVIDAGHGGDNDGAVGDVGIHEKHLTLSLAYALRAAMQRDFPSTRVVMTRYVDRSLSLTDRVAHANRVDADLFLSLHYNAAVHPRAVGVETYFLDWEQTSPSHAVAPSEMLAQVGSDLPAVDSNRRQGEAVGLYDDDLVTLKRDLARATQHRRSARLARLVQDRLLSRLSTVDRGVKQANFGVLRGALMPAVVVEAGFLTHPVEGRDLMTERHRSNVIRSLVEAVVAFDQELAGVAVGSGNEMPD